MHKSKFIKQEDSEKGRKKRNKINAKSKALCFSSICRKTTITDSYHHKSVEAGVSLLNY
jgi:hypothetical protein